MPKRRVKTFIRTLEAAGEVAWHRNLDTDELLFTPGFWASLGYSQEEAPQRRRDFAALIHPADFQHVRDQSARFIAGENSVLNLEFRLRSKAGEWRWYLMRGREIQRKVEGEPHIAAGIITDVDETRRGQLAALEDRERLNLALESSDAGIWELDLGTNELILDERSLAMHGLPLDLPMPTSQEVWLNALDRECRKKTIDAFKEAVTSGVTYSSEYSVGDGKGWINGIGKALLDEDGAPVRFVGLNIDITSRKRSERLIESMRGELLHAARHSAMGAMAATLAHELNQPLTAISNFASGVLRRVREKDLEVFVPPMEAITDNAQRAGEIIRRMRQMARSGQVRTEKIQFDQLVSEATGYAKAGCEGTAFELVLNDGVAVEADALQIQQVLINLIRNACQAMQEANSEPKVVTITTEDEGDFLKVGVSDRGPGLPEQSLTRIFDANFTTKAEGMGLGLSISRTIVEAHGGKLWATNTPEGASFYFTLPVTG